MIRRVARALALALALGATTADACLYLTIDTGSMAPAVRIAAILAKHQVKATFFLAAERAYDGGTPLDDRWRDFWRARVAEGHAFGSHTWRHWYLRQDVEGGIRYRAWGGKPETVLDKAGFCRELAQVDERFRALTGRALDPIWRAPGGATTPKSLAWAPDCGFARHVHWSPAGFLGDELPADKHPNEALLRQALRNIKDGDTLMMHLGTRDRKVQFVEVFDELLTGLKARGFCFATVGR